MLQKNLEMLIKSDSPFKLVINQMKEIGMHYKYFRFEYILIKIAFKLTGKQQNN